MDGVAVAVIEGGQMYFIRTDHIGRPVFATNSTGVKVWEAMYLPFGGVHTTTNTPVKLRFPPPFGGVHTSSGSNINLRFPGQWFQSESGLHQNWMRDYDPTTGRYMQADPLGLVDGASVYGYALHNPGRYEDRRGEFCTSYARRDGTIGIRCSGPTTYCPSGDCASQSPRNNNRTFEQCMKDCETALKKAGKFVAFTGAGAIVGAVTGTSIAGSAVASTACKIVVSETQCGIACGGKSCEANHE